MKFQTLIVLAASSLLLAPSALADSRAGTYTALSPGIIGVQCNDMCGLAVGVNGGGYHFAANGQTPTHVSVADDTGNIVYFNACQDSNGDGLCGDTGEPSVSACGTDADLTGFSAGLDTVVFVWSTDGLCLGSATSGVITLTSN